MNDKRVFSFRNVVNWAIQQPSVENMKHLRGKPSSLIINDCYLNVMFSGYNPIMVNNVASPMLFGCAPDSMMDPT